MWVRRITIPAGAMSLAGGDGARTAWAQRPKSCAPECEFLRPALSRLPARPPLCAVWSRWLGLLGVFVLVHWAASVHYISIQTLTSLPVGPCAGLAAGCAARRRAQEMRSGGDAWGGRRLPAGLRPLPAIENAHHRREPLCRGPVPQLSVRTLSLSLSLSAHRSRKWPSACARCVKRTDPSRIAQ